MCLGFVLFQSKPPSGDQLEQLKRPVIPLVSEGASAQPSQPSFPAAAANTRPAAARPPAAQPPAAQPPAAQSPAPAGLDLSEEELEAVSVAVDSTLSHSFGSAHAASDSVVAEDDGDGEEGDDDAADSDHPMSESSRSKSASDYDALKNKVENWQKHIYSHIKLVDAKPNPLLVCITCNVCFRFYVVFCVYLRTCEGVFISSTTNASVCGMRVCLCLTFRHFTIQLVRQAPIRSQGVQWLIAVQHVFEQQQSEII